MFCLGFTHSAFVFGYESNSSNSNDKGALVPAGALINIIRKGLIYTQVEICVRDDGTENEITERLTLIDAVIPDILATYVNTNQQRQDIAMGVEREEDSEVLFVSSSETITQRNNVDASFVDCTVLRGHESEVFMCSWCPTTDILASG